MGNISKRHDAVLKTKVALEAIKREKTILERYTGKVSILCLTVLLLLPFPLSASGLEGFYYRYLIAQRVGDKSETYEELIEKVKKAIREKDLPEAERVLKGMLKRYPDNSEVLHLLARVLFWQKRYDESIAIYKRLLSLRPADPEVKRGFERVLKAKELKEIDALIDSGQYGEAEERLLSLYKREGFRYEAGYRLGMLYIRLREYEKALEIFTELRREYPEDRGFEALYIESLILNGEIRKAKKELYSLPEDRRQYHYKKRDDLFYRVRRNHLRLNFSHYDYSKRGLQDENSYTIELSKRISEYTTVIRFSNIHRFGKRDAQLSGEFYTKLGEKTKRWGYISFTVSRDADFLPEWSIGGAVYQGYRDFEFSIGFSHMEFKGNIVDIVTPGLIIYLPRGIALDEKLYYVPKRGTLTLLNTINYEPNHRYRVYYSFAIGKSSETIGAAEDIEKFRTYSHRLGIEVRPLPELSLGVEALYTHRHGLYDKRGLGLSAKYLW